MKCTIGYVGAMNYASLQELQMVNNTLIPSYLDISYASFASLLPHAGKELDIIYSWLIGKWKYFK